MSVSTYQRGGRWYVRVSFPENRWGDIGRALGASKGIKRDFCRTLETSSRREAEERKLEAAASIRRDVDKALERLGLRPLTDWTADWMDRAAAHRETLREAGDDVVPLGLEDEDGHPSELAVREVVWERIEADEAVVRRRRGDDAAQRFRTVAGGKGMTVAEAARQWLAEERQKVRAGTIASHEAALRRLGAFLARTEGLPSLAGVALDAVSRQMAGNLLSERRSTSSWETVGRDFSAYSGLWRWAMRRGHTDKTPWADQLAGMKAPRDHDAGHPEKRGYSGPELVKLLRAGAGDLAPANGGYAATFWDVMRLSLLTGARASEMLNLRVCDVLEGGTAVVLAAEGGKTANAGRIIPLHPFAARVMADRLASLPDQSPTAPLWPEVPATGRDERRSKIIGNRFPAIRRRILGPDDGADFHSLRRSFLTACETAMHARGRINGEMVALLGGHKRAGMGFNLYSDWVRIGRASFLGRLEERLGTLQNAIEDAVEMGFSKDVKAALRETQGDRPATVRTAPAFRRS